MGKSLTEYVTEKSKHSRCSVCSLSVEVRHEIEQGRAAGVYYVTIAAWLAEEKKLTINEVAIRGHFRRGHHNGYDRTNA